MALASGSPRLGVDCFPSAISEELGPVGIWNFATLSWDLFEINMGFGNLEILEDDACE